MTSSPSTQSEREWRKGVALGLAAYLWWGFFPAFLKLVVHVPILELVCHRIVWCFLFLVVLMTALRRWKPLIEALRDKRTRWLLAGSTCVICINWLGMLKAVADNEIRQASLGYFINPLVSVLFGFLFLGERMRRAQTIAVVLAAGAVTVQALVVGTVPVLALVLAFSFGLYGLFRKVARVEALAGLTVETGVLVPVAVLYVLSLGDSAVFHSGANTDRALLMLAGVFTAVPLIMFAAMARRVKLATVGFLQYITPSLQLMLAIAVYGEAFTTGHAISFALIWAALGLYSFDLWKEHRTQG